MNAREWKAWYAREREILGEEGLARLLEEAPEAALPPRGALVFPHAKLSGCGAQVAAVARAVVASGAGEVLALGVLHGARAEDAAQVAAAKAGDPAARLRLRRLHGPGAPGDEGLWREEFSLDGFRALLAAAARRAGRPEPLVVERYPFLAGSVPASLPGLDEARALLARGAVLVATTDPVHHGPGYGTAAVAALDESSPGTRARILDALSGSFARLARREYPAFLADCEAWKSDFRDTGPAMAALLDGALSARIRDLRLVDYSDVLAAPRPTWVAAALAEFAPAL